MKKILTGIAITLLVAATTQAATITWGSSGYVYFETDAASSLNGFTTSAYLVYLGLSGDASWDNVDAVSIASGESTDYLATKSANFLGGVVASESPNPIIAWGDTFDTSGTDTFTANSSSFGIVFVTDAAGFDDPYYNLSDIYTVGAVGEPEGSETFSFEYSIPSDSSSETQGWQPVPEPGTILLGLAGAGALLARRRKSKKA